MSKYNYPKYIKYEKVTFLNMLSNTILTVKYERKQEINVQQEGNKEVILDKLLYTD